MTIKSDWKAPAMRPTLPRTSSAASGLRFCGMIEEPVVNLSDSVTKPISGEHHSTISSAKRDRCTAVIERSEEHTSELQSLAYLVCRLLLEKKKKNKRSPS